MLFQSCQVQYLKPDCYLKRTQDRCILRLRGAVWPSGRYLIFPSPPRRWIQHLSAALTSSPLIASALLSAQSSAQTWPSGTTLDASDDWMLTTFDRTCDFYLYVSALARLWPSLRDDLSCFSSSVDKTMVESPRRFLLTGYSPQPDTRMLQTEQPWSAAAQQ